MKKIIFLRHAKSDWADNKLSDFDRPLNERGFRVAPKMGNKLGEMGVDPDLVMCSPALRTRQTAELVLEHFDYPMEDVDYIDEIYEASPRTLLGLINNLDDSYGTVMIIGHNPSLTYIIEFLTGQDIGNLNTCSAAEITFDFRLWNMIIQNSGSLAWLVTPKQFEF